MLGKDWLRTAIGALLIRLGAQAPRDLSPAGLSVWAGLRQCGGWRRFDLKEIPVSTVPRTDTGDAAATTAYIPVRFNPGDRRTFIGGSDARIIMGNDEADLVRLWREKRGEIEPEDLNDNPIVQLGSVSLRN